MIHNKYINTPICFMLRITQVFRSSFKQMSLTSKKMAMIKPKPAEEKLCLKDIEYMMNTTVRGDNDHNNKIREQILRDILMLPQEYFEDSNYGIKWKELQVKWKILLEELCKVSYDKISIKQKAGRGHHYDFLVNYTHGEQIVDEAKVEFKHHCERLTKLPQFLSLPAKQDFLEMSYAEYYYDHYLDAYLAQDIEIKVEKPTKEAYLKMVFTTNYDVHPFFRCLYDRCKYFEKEKNKIVNDSIRSFLEENGSKLDLEKISEKFKHTQKDKIFVLWDLKQFHIDRLCDEDFNIDTNEGIKNGNSILIKSKKSTFQMLLRWRNHKGILLPAWQISIKHRT